MKKFIISTAVVLAFLFSTAIYAQPEPPDHGQGTNQPPPGGGAPIGSGLFILLGLGAAYGGKKLYDMNKEELEE